MKIHKLNLENYYRNVIDSAIAVLSHLPEAVFAGRPTFNNALLRFNDGEAPVLMLPKWSDIEIDLSQHKPSWAPASLTGTIKVSITPSVVGVEASADETSLGSFDVYGVTGTSTGKQYEVTEGKYTIEYAVSILDGEDNPVVVFSNGQALKVAMVKDADNGPDTTLDIPAGGGGSFTQEQADWSQSDDTKVDYIKNKPTIPTVNDATLTFTQDGETLATFSANASTNVEVEIPAGGGGDLMVEKTWSELKAMRDGGTLTPGQTYRITDYTCTTSTTNTQSAGNLFDIIVVADDENTLNENARAIKHDGDTYFSDCDLSAWELKYCLDNDTGRFAWADSTNGKGVVYFMKDEWGNECPYDFKNIKFSYMNGSNLFISYTIGASVRISVTPRDSSLTSPHYVTVEPTIVTGVQSLPSGGAFSLAGYFIKVGPGCKNIEVSSSSYNITLGRNVTNVTLSGECYSIEIGDRLIAENPSTLASKKTEINNCKSVVIGFESNGIYMKRSNSVAIGDECKNIRFGDASSLKLDYKNIEIESGVQYVNLSCTGTTNISTLYQNVKICSGVKGTSSTPLTISDSNVNQAYQTTFFNETDGTLKKQEGSTVNAYTPPA